VPIPQLTCDIGAVSKVAQQLSKTSSTKPLIITDKTLKAIGLVDQVLNCLDEHHVNFSVFDQVTPDPTIAIVKEGVEHFRQNQCDSIIALGGGSVIDCAKGVAASVAKKKDINQLSGLFRVRKTLPSLIAIPTTAGTGSEATLVSVISDPAIKKKFTVIDPCLVPSFAILDPQLMTGLPANITAETGIDALTHAIESYIGLHATKETKAFSIDAIQRIFTYLPVAYQEGSNIVAREQMALASYYAGLAFTRTSVGYVHAIAHQLGAVYHIPHGLANAVLLPHVLEFSYENVVDDLAEIAYKADLVDNKQDKHHAAKAFVEKVKALLTSLAIQTSFSKLQANDIPELAQRAIGEAYCDYPVPRLMSTQQCESILKALLPMRES